MRFQSNVLGQLLQPICRRGFRSSVVRHGGDAYVKSFDSWSHLVVLVQAQLSGASSLRALETEWAANAGALRHLGTSAFARATLADANARRPVAIFAETFARLSALAARKLRREGQDLIRIIDSSPIPLSSLVADRTTNGRIKGLKLHVVYDSASDHPRRIDITEANINDIDMGRAIEIEAGARYVFDKGYCDYRWWAKIHDAGATFVTRPKANVSWHTTARRPITVPEGDGFTVLDDDEVTHTTRSKVGSRLTMPLRRIRVRRHDGGGTLALITNDLKRTAVEIAKLYKTRWQIELLFRWIKQHLELRRFLGNTKNAIQLQIIAAMIAHLLLRLAARARAIEIDAIRFAELVGMRLFLRWPIDLIDKPPIAAKRSTYSHPAQLTLGLK